LAIEHGEVGAGHASDAGDFLVGLFKNAVQGHSATVNPQNARPQQYYTVEVVWFVGEKLLHALLICVVLKVRMDLETFDISIFIWPF